jgi:hypothetical protein
MNVDMDMDMKMTGDGAVGGEIESWISLGLAEVCEAGWDGMGWGGEVRRGGKRIGLDWIVWVCNLTSGVE